MNKRLTKHFQKTGAKILIQRADRLGDMVLALPVIEALKKQYPDLIIHVLASPINANLLAMHPHVEKVIQVTWKEGQKVTNKKELISQLRAENYTAYISLWNHPYMAYLAWRAKIPIRIGDVTSLLFLTHKINQYSHDITQHQIEQNLRLIKDLIPENQLPIKRLYPDPAWEETVQTAYRNFKDPGKKTVFIFCGTGGSSHDIPEAAILGFIKKLADSHQVILSYGELRVDSILIGLELNHLLNIPRRLSFPELISWINQCDYYVGADTGPTHLASFLNKPVLNFSPKKNQFPTRWGPTCDYFKIIRDDIQCKKPCLSICRPERECAFLDSDHLTNAFFDLVSKVSLQESFNPTKRKREHLRHTFRIAYIVRTKTEYTAILPTIESLQEKNILLFPVYFSLNPYTSLRRILTLVTRRNITIIHGEIPCFIVWAIRFYMATIKQYVAPVHLTLPLHQYLKGNDLIDLYHLAWKKTR
ncbi:MAG: lipopolysaccharide heptosyltransferase family protein [Candidatus Margulisbacteria bacterium]|nr:lipopolysaccharide heptosyltransferase family protein [Candidatus Margulisiibacteriota bacterium]